MFPLKHLLILVFIICCSIAGGAFILHFDLLSKFSSMLGGVLAVLGLLPTIVGGYGYNRLSVFDSLDGIDAKLKKTIRSKVKDIRAQLLQLILFSAISVMVTVLSCWVIDSFDAVKYFFAIYISFFFLIVLATLISLPPILAAIEFLRERVDDEKQKEKKRQALVAELQKEREKSPIVIDDRLKGYTNVRSVHFISS